MGIFPKVLLAIAKNETTEKISPEKTCEETKSKPKCDPKKKK